MSLKASVDLHRWRARAGLVMSAAVLLCALSSSAVHGQDKGDAEMHRTADQLHQIGRAMLAHAEKNQAFPTAAICSKDSKPLLSWRVALLPFLGEEALYRQFKLDEPWDSPNNRPLLAKIPKVYAPAGKAQGPAGTTYFQGFQSSDDPRRSFTSSFFQAVVSLPGAPKGRAMPPQPTRFADIIDGAPNTLMVVEAAAPLPWTQPVDLPYAATKPLARLGRSSPDGFLALFCDGATVRLVPKDLPEKTLRDLITINGAEVVRSDQIGKPIAGTAEPPKP